MLLLSGDGPGERGQDDPAAELQVHRQLRAQGGAGQGRLLCGQALRAAPHRPGVCSKNHQH